MHHGFGINADGHIAKTPGSLVGVPSLFRRREDERAASTETSDFLGETIEGADAEDHASGGLVVKKRAHARPQYQIDFANSVAYNAVSSRERARDM